MTQTVDRKADFTGWLRWNLHEDEAEMTGLRFTIRGDKAVVENTFHFDEYADFAEPRTMSRPAARKLWAECLAENEGGDPKWPCWTAYSIGDRGQYHKI